MRRWGQYAVMAVAIVVIGAGLFSFSTWISRRAAEGPASIGGPFTLVDGAGKTVQDSDFRGRWMLVFFGYTNCPDVCPTTLNDLAAAFGKLPPADRARLVPLFITVDPERDTPAVLHDYMHAFGPEFVGLTGSPAQVATVEREYRVYAAKIPLKGGGYGMEHSAFLYLMNPQGDFVTVLPDSDTPADMAQKLRALGA